MFPLTHKRLLQAARLTTGLQDFGTPDFEEPLALLIEGFNTTADLNAKGKVAVWSYMHRLMSNRLQLTNRLNRQPEVAGERVNAPVFILGLPRTGSTLLHGLLARHPSLRAPTYWETMFVPAKGSRNLSRKLMARAQVFTVDTLSPGFRRVHELHALEPHECVTIQASAMRSMQFHAAHRLTAYNQWLASCDWQPAYDFHKCYLQWLQSGEQPSHWLLKAPGHLLAIGELLNTYPDARIIQLHRDPLDVIPSMASLFVHLRRPFSKRLDPEEIGRDLSEQWLRGLNTTLLFRGQHPELSQQFLDIHYRELVTQPLDTAAQIFAFLGLPFEPNMAESLEAHLAARPKNRFGSHEYTLEQFGLNPQKMKTDFNDYICAHAI